MNTPTPTPEKILAKVRNITVNELYDDLFIYSTLKAMQEYAESYHASKMKERAGIGAKELAAQTIMKLHTSGEREWHIFITEAIEKYHVARSFISEESGIDIEYLIIQACKEYENTTPDTYPIFVEKVKEISKSIAHQFPSQPSPVKLPTNEEIRKEFPTIEGEHNIHCQVGAKWMRDKWSSSLTGQQEGWKPCGQGDNICNCKSAEECGYRANY